MRKIGELSGDREAQLFHDTLFVHGIENDIESEENGAFSIWIHDDDQREKASALLEKFRQSPDAADWQAATKATKLRKQAAREDARRASNIITRERMDYERNFVGMAWVPLVLAVLSIAATIMAGEIGLMPGSSTSLSFHESTEAEMMIEAEHRQKLWEYLSITRQRIPTTPEGLEALTRLFVKEGFKSTNAVKRRLFDRSLPEIRSGEVWRLFTPALVHLGIIHLVFNLIWLRNLGTFAQNRFGAAYLIVLVLSSAAVSNLVQLAWSGPMFGGLSGVNYALFGFLWMRGKYDRTLLWQMPPHIIQTMMIWFFACILIIPNVANAAHAAGLIFGCIAGFLTAIIASTRRAR